MGENYKFLYEQMKHMVTQYQDEIIPGFMEQLENQIDAVPVVRCKNCIYKAKSEVNKKGYLICPASGMEITDEDFCSYGESVEKDG